LKTSGTNKIKEKHMPHIIVKCYTGRSEDQKQELTKKIAKNVVEILDCKDTAVSIAFEEIDQSEWPQKVYQPDIIDCPGTLYKKPGYNPFLSKQDKNEDIPSLKENVREAALIAQKEDATDHFNPMSWLDIALEDNPESFDDFFDTPWNELSDAQKEKRCISIRKVL
jgi:4-oxalocrotonate tautomerase